MYEETYSKMSYVYKLGGVGVEEWRRQTKIIFFEDVTILEVLLVDDKHEGDGLGNTYHSS